jgi:hypothetical protein
MIVKKKSTLLAVLVSLVILGSLAVAQAQSFVNSGSDPNNLFVVGWNYSHINYCQIDYDGSTTWSLAFSQENPAGVLYTNNPVFQNTIAPACGNGNWIGVHVTSLNPIQWDQIYTFTSK